MAMLLASAVAQDASSYVLGPEDVVVITVIDQPKFSGEYLIPDNGRITLPVVGEVAAGGMTIEQLRVVTTNGLKKRLVRPEVAVMLKVARPKRVYVFGEVQRPGILELKPGWRIQEAVSAAGGLNSGLEQRDARVVLERAKGTKVEMSLDEALNSEQASKLIIEPGDVLRVEVTPLTPIYVTGKVKTPGLFKLREKEAGVLEAIAQAGGVSDDANITSVRIIRLDGTEETVDLSPALLRGETVKLPRLKTGDMVLVSESQDRFAVLGFVNKPGYYSIPSGKKMDLSQAVAMAAGNDKRGRISRIGVMRLENGKETRKVYDLGKYFQKGDVASNPMIRPGDVIYVPETNRVDVATILSGLATGSLLFRAFGG
jgi:polysaccharide export outer membrane protein